MRITSTIYKNHPFQVNPLVKQNMDKFFVKKQTCKTSHLSVSDISNITDIVSAENRLRFVVEYLGINRNEYKTIEADAHFKHFDIMFECITRWKDKMEAMGNNSKDELIRILTHVSQEHGWFPLNEMTFFTDGKETKMPDLSLSK